ncbi:hypothetical protein JTB14_024834 [Gonioctena quinquepunctata]|nr:hypothetical protein JTB14_024834 [Gonioctena quinquepunctata]
MIPAPIPWARLASNTILSIHEINLSKHVIKPIKFSKERRGNDKRREKTSATFITGAMKTERKFGMGMKSFHSRIRKIIKNDVEKTIAPALKAAKMVVFALCSLVGGTNAKNAKTKLEENRAIIKSWNIWSLVCIYVRHLEVMDCF